MKTSLFHSGAALLMLALAVSTHSVPALATAKGRKSKSTAARSWVTLKASTDQKRYAVGQPIQVRLTATNTAKRGAYLRFTSGQRFDFSVVPVGGKDSVYTWSAARMFIQATGSLWLKPGQSQAFKADIGDEMGQLKPGKYRLLARLTNVPRPIVAAPVEFEIAPAAFSMITRTDKDTYMVGEEVKIFVTAANRSGKAQTLHYDSGLDCDVHISDEAEKLVWTYGANLRFIRALGDVTWPAGQTKNFEFVWNGVALPGENVNEQLQPGRYRLQAFFPATPQVVAAPVYINITR